MSHSQFYCIKSFILRHAWLNLWDERMTTGRIDQIAFFLNNWFRLGCKHLPLPLLSLISTPPVQLMSLPDKFVNETGARSMNMCIETNTDQSLPCSHPQSPPLTVSITTHTPTQAIQSLFSSHSLPHPSLSLITHSESSSSFKCNLSFWMHCDPLSPLTSPHLWGFIQVKISSFLPSLPFTSRLHGTSLQDKYTHSHSQYLSCVCHDVTSSTTLPSSWLSLCSLLSEHITHVIHSLGISYTILSVLSLIHTVY